MKPKFRKLIFFTVYLAYTSIYIARVNLSIAGPALMDQNILNTVQLGMLGSVFSTIYAVGRLVNGGLSDRNPPWAMLSAGLGLSGLANILFGFFPPFAGIFLLWTANAYAQSMLWSSVLCTISGIYDKEAAKRKTSIMITSVAMGNILGILLNTFLITRFGAGFAFFVPGAITLLLGVAVLFVTHSVVPPAAEKSRHISMLHLLKQPELRAMSLPAMFHGVMKENVSLWMAVYIVDQFQTDLSKSSYYILLIPLIGFFGRLLYPMMYKLFHEKENAVSFLGFGVCIVCAVLLCTGILGVTGSVLCLSGIYTAVSMVNTSILSIFPLGYLKTGNVASVSGLMDFATYLGAGIASVIYGVVIRHWGYLPMFLSWVVISALSIWLIAIIDRKKAA